MTLAAEAKSRIPRRARKARRGTPARRECGFWRRRGEAMVKLFFLFFLKREERREVVEVGRERGRKKKGASERAFRREDFESIPFDVGLLNLFLCFSRGKFAIVIYKYKQSE